MQLSANGHYRHDADMSRSISQCAVILSTTVGLCTIRSARYVVLYRLNGGGKGREIVGVFVLAAGSTDPRTLPAGDNLSALCSLIVNYLIFVSS
mmetsp:Transcript_41034/g.68574  ORF Transcript_41034/g.68574 Transcript_41034/m.68574 type:complete len:94 (+) Transcript_41034:38-319(+)